MKKLAIGLLIFAMYSSSAFAGEFVVNFKRCSDYPDKLCAIAHAESRFRYGTFSKNGVEVYANTSLVSHDDLAIIEGLMESAQAEGLATSSPLRIAGGIHTITQYGYQYSELVIWNIIHFASGAGLPPL